MKDAAYLPDPGDPSPKVLGCLDDATVYAQMRSSALGREQTIAPFTAPGTWLVATTPEE